MTNVRWVRLGSVGHRTQGALCVFHVRIETSKKEDKSWDRGEDDLWALEKQSSEGT